MSRRSTSSQYPFIVYDKTEEKYAGCTRFYDINNSFSNALLGYTWYGQQFQGTGINKQCKELLLSFAFETCDFERLAFSAVCTHPDHN